MGQSVAFPCCNSYRVNCIVRHLTQRNKFSNAFLPLLSTESCIENKDNLAYLCDFKVNYWLVFYDISYDGEISVSVTTNCFVETHRKTSNRESKIEESRHGKLICSHAQDVQRLVMIWCKPSWLINQSYQLVKDLAEIQSLSPNKNFVSIFVCFVCWNIATERN